MLIVEPFRVESILDTDVSKYLFPNSIRIYSFIFHDSHIWLLEIIKFLSK